MDKSLVTAVDEVELPALTADEKPSGVKRKPLATPAQAYTAATQTQLQSADQDYEKQSFTTLPPRGYLPSQRRSLAYRARTRWTALKRRSKIVILVAIVCVLAFITGLAAGLSSRSRVQNLPLPSSHGGPYTGDLTYYEPGLGACGLTDSSSDAIVAVSHIIFDAVSVGSNPNANPLCGKKIRARRNDKSVDLTVVDRCVGCKATDIDTTTSVFAELAEIAQGRVTVSWSWLEDVPSAASS